MDDAMEGEPPAADPAVEVDEGVERMDVDAEMGVGVGMGADAELQSDLSDAGAEPMQADFEADQSMPTSSPALALDLPLEPAIHASAPNPAQLSFTASDPPAPVTPDQPAPPAQPEPPAQPAPPAPGTWAALATLPEETGDHYLRYRRLLAAAEATFTPQLLKYGREEFATPRGADLPEYVNSRSTITHGEDTERRIRWWLNNLGYKRTMLQIQMHNEIINALLPQIYGKEWDQNQEAILARKKLTRHYSDVVLQTGRRMGKSWGTAIIIVALLMVMPKFEVMVFSLSKDNAKKMVELVRGMFPDDYMKNATFKTDNQNRVSFRMPGDPHGTYRSITALSSLDVVRGEREWGESGGDWEWEWRAEGGKWRGGQAGRWYGSAVGVGWHGTGHSNHTHQTGHWTGCAGL